jgi:ribosomal protein S18 acetylase RimI-like enzyme
MVNELNITVATKEDIPELEKLVNGAYRGDSSKKGWTTEADLLGGIRTNTELLAGMISRGDSIILKCTNAENKLVGCVYLQKQEDKLYLGMLTVAPDIQAKGIGKRLLQAAEEYAQMQQCTAIKMMVISLRKELINWYERRGYKATGERKPFPSNDPRFGLPKQELEFIAMEKQFLPDML